MAGGGTRRDTFSHELPAWTPRDPEVQHERDSEGLPPHVATDYHGETAMEDVDVTQGRLVIAIDGPSGVGKSTAARAVAARLGLSYVESGAMYRAIALLALESGTALTDGTALGKLAAGADFQFETGSGGNRLRLNGRDVTEAIRT